MAETLLAPNATNPTLYNNNDPPTFDTGYDGFTDVFTAQALNLAQELTQLAIADTVIQP